MSMASGVWCSKRAGTWWCTPYTFTGDKRGKPGTCTGPCAAVWPPVRGIPVLARGVKIHGKFGSINGQVTFNGWPLYRFTGEGPGRNHADHSFKLVTVRT